MAKFPFQAHIRTEFGGTGFKRCKTFDEAVAKATNEKNPAPHIQIVERWVANTKGEICGEPICHYCGDTHYYDCPCPGPDSEDNN